MFFPVNGGGGSRPLTGNFPLKDIFYSLLLYFSYTCETFSKENIMNTSLPLVLIDKVRLRLNFYNLGFCNNIEGSLEDFQCWICVDAPEYLIMVKNI